MTRSISSLIVAFAAFHCSFGQNELTLSTSIIYSSIEVPNNWSPPTAVNRQNKFKGNGLGWGTHVTYSFHPNFLIKNKNIRMNLGFGYFKQLFNIERPFDYDSPMQPIFYTDNYSYHCFQSIVGFAYTRSIGSKFSINGNLSYRWLRSFRQDYTPTASYGHGDLTQVNRNQIDFGDLLILEIGVNRNLGNRYSVALNLLTPLYARWRNDKIFKDDTSTYSHPRFSLGSSISVIYNLRRRLVNHKA